MRTYKDRIECMKNKVYIDKNGKYYMVRCDEYGLISDRQYIDKYENFNNYKSEPKQKTEEELLIEKIKKLKRINEDDVYGLIETIINTKNKEIANSLQEKLEYLGITWYDKINITSTTDPNQLIKDLIYSFVNLRLDSEVDLKKYKFVISKIKQFEEWEEFVEE